MNRTVVGRCSVSRKHGFDIWRKFIEWCIERGCLSGLSRWVIGPIGMRGIDNVLGRAAATAERRLVFSQFVFSRRPTPNWFRDVHADDRYCDTGRKVVVRRKRLRHILGGRRWIVRVIQFVTASD